VRPSNRFLDKWKAVREKNRRKMAIDENQSRLRISHSSLEDVIRKDELEERKISRVGNQTMYVRRHAGMMNY
jgi:hypothetical protein